jgi:hypothetical protein
MLPEEIDKRWKDISKAVRDEWGEQITDEDLERSEHSRDALCRLLNQQCDLSPEEADEEVDRILLEQEARPYI